MNKSDYNKHIHTMKHLSRIPESEPTIPIMNMNMEERVKDTKLFLCSHCNKAYKSKNGLHYHSKKCICGAIVDISNEIIPIDISFLEIHEHKEELNTTGKAGHDVSTMFQTSLRNSPDLRSYEFSSSCENTKIIGRIAASFDDIPFSRMSSANSIIDIQPKKNDDDDDDCEYIDEAFHMGIILDLLPEADENMTEFILYSANAVMIGFVVYYFVITYMFTYVTV